MAEAIRVVNICGISPLRRDSTDRSEMVSQMLLGETAEVLDMQEKWLHIRLDFDGYVGWVNRNEMRFMPEHEWVKWMAVPKFRNNYASMIVAGKPRPVFVPLGAVLGKLGGDLIIPGEVMESVIPDTTSDAQPADYARAMLGTPYLWGGRTDVGIDCSGLIQTAFLLAGFKMPRDAWQQFELGYIRNGGITEAQSGDLCYFGTEGRITHVGFYEGAGTLLHAQGFVKRENLLVETRFSNPFPLHTALFDKLLGVQNAMELKKSLPKAVV